MRRRERKAEEYRAAWPGDSMIQTAPKAARAHLALRRLAVAAAALPRLEAERRPPEWRARRRGLARAAIGMSARPYFLRKSTELRKQTGRRRAAAISTCDYPRLAVAGPLLAAAGNRKRKVAPCPGSLETSIVPPCNWTSRNVMASPMPDPFSLVVKYRLKIFF